MAAMRVGTLAVGLALRGSGVLREGPSVMRGKAVCGGSCSVSSLDALASLGGAVGEAELWGGAVGEAGVWSGAVGEARLWGGAVGEAGVWSSAVGEAG